MGEVFIAEHPALGRRAAVKFIRPELSSNPENLNRFFNEARAATLVRHPGIVDVFDYGVLPSGSAFFVMEYLEGETLSSRLRREGRLAPVLLVPVFDQMADALGAAHGKGIIHRDLKPDNVFLVPDRAIPCGLRVKVLDFGIAKLADATAASPMTQSGSVLGTPAYMSPEQCSGARHVDFRTDVYSLGCMLFEAVAGRLPFPAPGLGEMLAAHLHLAPPPLRTLDPGIPAEIERLVDRALAKAPEVRQQSMAEMQAELAALLAAGVVPATPTGGSRQVPAVASQPGSTMLSIAPSGAPSSPGQSGASPWPSQPAPPAGHASQPGYASQPGHPIGFPASPSQSGYGVPQTQPTGYAPTGYASQPGQPMQPRYGAPPAQPPGYPAPSPPMTTLSSAVVSSRGLPAQPGHSRRWMIGVLGAAVGAGCVVAALALRGASPAPGPAPTVAAAPITAPVPAAAAAPAVAAAPAAAAAAPPAATAPPPAATAPPSAATAPPPAVTAPPSAATAPPPAVTAPPSAATAPPAAATATPPPAAETPPAPPVTDAASPASRKPGRPDRARPGDVSTTAQPANSPAPASGAASAATPPPATDKPDKPELSAAEQLYERARARYVARDYNAAIQLTQQVVKEPSAGARQKRNAWLLMGQSYCFLRHRDGAYRAWIELPQNDRDDLKAYCARASITLP